jgi:hypothetical protein
MNIEEYQNKIKEIHFEEFPFVITGTEPLLSEIINYKEANLDLKIYLSELIICRCFPSSGGVYWPSYPEWFIQNFIEEFELDLIKPWITPSIKEAMQMILSGDTFGKGVIATTFMFGIVEFYAKYNLGFNPSITNYFDKKHTSFREMSISEAIIKLKKTNTGIARSLNYIDKHNCRRIKELEIKEGGWTKAKIAERLLIARNPMIHGENHSFYDKAKYLVMLYILFHLYQLREQES